MHGPFSPHKNPIEKEGTGKGAGSEGRKGCVDSSSYRVSLGYLSVKMLQVVLSVNEADQLCSYVKSAFIKLNVI